MRASYEDINSKKGNESFLAYYLDVPSFPFKWHYHPEYELTLITRGNGTRIVGDSYENFETGDLVLIGPDMPHTWVSSSQSETVKSSAIVIQFSANLLQNFLQYQEFSAVTKLLEGSAYGYFFRQKHDKKIVTLIKALPRKQGVEKLTTLLSILGQLGLLHPVKLASKQFIAVKGIENENRINKVCQYIQKHATENISLSKTASLIYLSNAAFCRFFKRATSKTFSDYVNDIRIGQACFLLNGSDKTIAEIAYESGFESLTYFNRVFLRKKLVTPRIFRNRLHNL